ncbi:MAG: hypothetical protein AABZ47_02280 [Planctomycetota bacterium]
MSAEDGMGAVAFGAVRAAAGGSGQGCAEKDQQSDDSEANEPVVAEGDEEKGEVSHGKVPALRGADEF